MSLPLARTSAEAHLYMDLSPCRCGGVEFPRQSAVVEADGDLATHYAGECARCGAPREFLFRLPRQILVPGPDEIRFGGDQPSELLDPGEWLWAADGYAGRGPADLSGLDPDQRAAAQRDLATAAAAVDEVLKFIPPAAGAVPADAASASTAPADAMPAGAAPADAVPAAAFRSDRGRAVYAAEPGRFRRARLEAVRDAYRDLLAAART